MNCKYRIIFRYVLLGIIYFISWYWLERGALVDYKVKEIFSYVVGTHGGYGYFLIIASAVMIINLLYVSIDLKLFFVSLLSRKNRTEAIKLSILNVTKVNFYNTLVYVIVEVICIAINLPRDILFEYNFYPVMLLYFISIFNIFLFGNLIYALVYVVSRKQYISMLLTVAINIFIAFDKEVKIFYGGISIIDKMAVKQHINYIEWGMYQLINICILSLLYLLIEEVYRKKDVL